MLGFGPPSPTMAAPPTPATAPAAPSRLNVEPVRVTNYYVAYPGNTPENHQPTEARMIKSKRHRGCRIQDLGPVATGGGKQPTFRIARAQRTLNLGAARVARQVLPL